MHTRDVRRTLVDRTTNIASKNSSMIRKRNKKKILHVLLIVFDVSTTQKLKKSLKFTKKLHCSYSGVSVKFRYI